MQTGLFPIEVAGCDSIEVTDGMEKSKFSCDT